MNIKKYDYYKFAFKELFFLNIRYGDHEDLPFCITKLFHEIYPYEWAEWYKGLITQEEFLYKIGIFPDVEVVFDTKNNLVYIVDAYEDDYRLARDVTKETVLQRCYDGRLQYTAMPYENFVALIASWANLLEKKPVCILLYQDENDWYDVMPFETEQAMKLFVADHLQK